MTNVPCQPVDNANFVTYAATFETEVTSQKKTTG